MDRHNFHDNATSNVLAWTTTNSANVEPSVEEDAGADADEPPDCSGLTLLAPMSPVSKHFNRTPVRRGSEHHESLLTRALQSHSDDEDHESVSHRRARRRRSVTSNFSLASTAELTCDTGVTTPARTSSPSPRLADAGFVPLAAPNTVGAKDPAVQALEKKRCISFACAAKPKVDDRVLMPPPPKPVGDGAGAPAPPKKTTIKFACPSRPPAKTASAQQAARPTTPVPRSSSSRAVQVPRSPSTVRAAGSPVPRKSPPKPAAIRKTWITANPSDLMSEGTHFHEFASDEPREDDWIRRNDPPSLPKLTINDTLKKENAIRKLGKEAEEEAELEEEMEDGNQEDDEDGLDEDDGDDRDNSDDDNDNDEEEDDNEADDDVDEDDVWPGRYPDEVSDGYKTDNETGFADSDDEDDDLILWTIRGAGLQSLSGATAYRRPSVGENSDSSLSEHRSSAARKRRQPRARPVPVRPATPELPDSTDFVCGTLDEDRPLEEAYISCVAARKIKKHVPIPQDIDPSFPTSEPEDEAEELYNKGYGDSDDDVWLHGELEDLHHERDRRGRKKKADVPSPKRYHSPPPKRRPSPAPKARGRSPRKLFDRHSPRRLRSPAPVSSTKSPHASPILEGAGDAFESLAVRPDLTHTKSLPRASGIFPHPLKQRRSRAGTATDETHVRGAIDIVKGLEQKRQRRKEKFYQKYYSRARKEKAQQVNRRPPPGQGAERMRELGLQMAGKAGQGNYVLSI